MKIGFLLCIEHKAYAKWKQSKLILIFRNKYIYIYELHFGMSVFADLINEEHVKYRINLFVV